MNLGKQWEQTLLHLQEQIDPRDVMIWFRDTKPLRLHRDKLIIQVENTFYADWIRDNYMEALRGSAQRVFSDQIQVEFTIPDPAAPAAPEPEPEPQPAPPMMDHAPPPARRPKALNGKMTFKNFVVGPCNEFAHAAAQAVADAPAQHYNPLFIYGDTGLGKTHLMHAIGHKVLGGDRTAQIVYVTAENFMNEMINSIRSSSMDDFRSKYRTSATVLLVDDIQFLSGRERTQEEFFHTFNALRDSGRQIILTADVEPAKIKALAPRLRTRFEGGLLADTQAPDKETMLAIMGHKCERQGFYLPPDLADAIANTVQGNVREVEGIINQLSALKRFYPDPLTLEFARKHLPKLFAPPPVKVTTLAIIEAVAKFHNLRAADITGKRRTRMLTQPRHIAMYLARHHTQLSFPELGREFGGRDHSTIQHGCRKIERELTGNADLRYQLHLIEQSLQLRPRT